MTLPDVTSRLDGSLYDRKDAEYRLPDYFADRLRRRKETAGLTWSGFAAIGVEPGGPLPNMTTRGQRPHTGRCDCDP